MVPAASRYVVSVNAEAGAWLREGQRLEVCGDAVSCRNAIERYDRALALLDGADPSARKARAIVWMNRGNASQRTGVEFGFAEAIRCYDATITEFEHAFGFPSGCGGIHTYGKLQIDAQAQFDPVMLNALGAAWMNRGVALQQTRCPENLEAAVSSHERAIEVFSKLPIDRDWAFRRNLGAAFLNLADALLDFPENAGLLRAANAARYSIQLTDTRADAEVTFAELNLKARRALIVAQGGTLCGHDLDPRNREALESEIWGTIEGGLGLARHWRVMSCEAFADLEIRLFRLGCHFLRIHHTRDLNTFVRENVEDRRGTLREEFKAVAAEAIQAALEVIGRTPVQSRDFANSIVQVDVLRELRETHRWLARSTQASALGVPQGEIGIIVNQASGAPAGC
ncbi:MAG: hypothetical protein K1X42_05800 [Opitutaceae bacterium]|nr:hypothetical protein [Opitutaceae bacterium]